MPTLTIFVDLTDDCLESLFLDAKTHHLENFADCVCVDDTFVAKAIEAFHQHLNLFRLKTNVFLQIKKSFKKGCFFVVVLCSRSNIANEP